jgi:Fe-S-cluster containining protein
MNRTALPIIESCTGCGACCLDMGIPPFYPADPFFATLPTHLARKIRPLLATPAPKIPCIWLNLETKQCMHYEYRPQICREFVMAGQECRQTREECEIK